MFSRNKYKQSKENNTTGKRKEKKTKQTNFPDIKIKIKLQKVVVNKMAVSGFSSSKFRSASVKFNSTFITEPLVRLITP
jgi:hypothetical protein